MDRKKLDELITENMRTVLGFALTRLGNVHEAEELASDIIYRLLRSAENIRDDGRFYAYMRRVAENAYVDRMRGKRREFRQTSLPSIYVPKRSSPGQMCTALSPPSG